MKTVRRGLVGLGGITLALAPLAFGAASLGSSAGAQVSVEPIVVEFTSVGAHDYTVPDDARCIEVYAVGAEGGAGENGESGAGGLGGSVLEEIQVLPGQALQVNVGGRGGDGDGNTGVGGAGGFNGGGAGGTAVNPDDFQEGGGGGGGASDVRQGGTSLADRAIVAAGGGGAAAWQNDGGDGGDPGANGGDSGDEPGGGGATVSAPGAGAVSVSAPGTGDGFSGVLGAGGAGGGGSTDTIVAGGGGGGGGYYGGGGGAAVASGGGTAGGGGGGVNFIATQGAGGGTGIDAQNEGNGRVTLSYVPGDTSCVAAPLTIVKSVSGAAPAGTQFTISVRCGQDTIDLGSVGRAGVASSVDLTFTADANGVAQPAVGQTISFVSSNECEVIETDTGGAVSTTYACSGSGAISQGSVSAESWDVSDTAVVAPGDPCVAAGPQTDPLAVEILAPRQTATVTVQNTFAAAAAAVTPRFTG